MFSKIVVLFFVIFTLHNGLADSKRISSRERSEKYAREQLKKAEETKKHQVLPYIVSNPFDRQSKLIIDMSRTTDSECNNSTTTEPPTVKNCSCVQQDVKEYGVLVEGFFVIASTIIRNYTEQNEGTCDEANPGFKDETDRIQNCSLVAEEGFFKIDLYINEGRCDEFVAVFLTVHLELFTCAKDLSDHNTFPDDLKAQLQKFAADYSVVLQNKFHTCKNKYDECTAPTS